MTDTYAGANTIGTIFRPPHRLESAFLYSLYKLLYTRRARCSLLGAELLPTAAALSPSFPASSTVDTRLLSVCLPPTGYTGIAALSPYSFRPLSDVERGYRYNCEGTHAALFPYK